MQILFKTGLYVLKIEPMIKNLQHIKFIQDNTQTSWILNYFNLRKKYHLLCTYFSKEWRYFPNYFMNIICYQNLTRKYFKKGKFENFWLLILMNVDANILKKYQQIKSCNIEVWNLTTSLFSFSECRFGLTFENQCSSLLQQNLEESKTRTLFFKYEK